jgi:hypothetical protein
MFGSCQIFPPHYHGCVWGKMFYIHLTFSVHYCGCVCGKIPSSCQVFSHYHIRCRGREGLADTKCFPLTTLDVGEGNTWWLSVFLNIGFACLEENAWQLLGVFLNLHQMW